MAAKFVTIPEAEFTCKPFSLIGDDWMLITAEKPDGSINTMTAGWGGLGYLWGSPAVFAFIRPQRYTKEFVDESSRFSLCFFGASWKPQLAYLGQASGRDEDKISRAWLTVLHEDNTPYFEEARIAVLTEKVFAQDIDPSCFIDKAIIEKWYPEHDFHTMYVGRVTRVLQKENVRG